MNQQAVDFFDGPQVYAPSCFYYFVWQLLADLVSQGGAWSSQLLLPMAAATSSVWAVATSTLQASSPSLSNYSLLFVVHVLVSKVF